MRQAGTDVRTPRSPAVVVAVALPVLLAVAVAVLAIVNRDAGKPPPPTTDTTPLAAAPVDAPDASGPQCTALLAALPATLPGGDGQLATRPLADPAPAGVRAWAAPSRPVVLRCGLPRPAELTPTSALVVVDGVSWLQLPDDVPDPVQSSWVAVDRPTYVAVTTPATAGSGPLQAISDAITATMPATPIAVR
ncbi:hypothetical protein Psed_4793 [Pseudonocardia dioxanivorans CB1190]|uniref:Uncharacterized protein n=1 Tax=Pseudonocardia dioxanivorans (strain ATCC 55486 / DSM 44775 / JCM 13855 / CB1190) TaxID=675635 RepID=F4D1M7_PSEUX|nr:DUF3515 domain-containing protein [Pseudonocardia dioxanivorans]AEA26939.1 hypothetical protein Psed_4793 [Pseudonocardia dioxanivorans CB1190]